MATPPKPPSSSRRPTQAESSGGDSGRFDDSADALPPEPATGPAGPPPTMAFHETQSGDGGEGPPHIPGYDILGELGRGGMGVVYKARQLQLGRLVALKMSRSGEMNADEMARFRAEAEAVARLRHPNIVQIYEIGDCKGRPFFSFEFVEGGNLADMLRGMPQPARVSAEIVETLARAMHFGHEQGIIHRDLKPANVLLAGATTGSAGSRDETLRLPALGSPQHIPKIADFGIAKRLDKHSLQTATGAVLGTPNYMAPEQAWGSDKRKPIGPQADVYALGAILYEMLTGRPPFLGETPLDTLQQVVTQEPVAPTRLRSTIPRDLETICLKCLQKEPARRYSTAEGLAEDLRAYQEDRNITAKPASAWSRLLRWRRRNPAVAALLFLVLILLAAGTSISTYFAIEMNNVATQNLEYARQMELSAETEKENARMADENARLRQQKIERDRLYYGSTIAFANRALNNNDIVRGLELLDGLIPSKGQTEDLRDFEWHYMRRRCGGKPMTLSASEQAIQTMIFCPDGATLATANAAQGDEGKSAPVEIRLWEAQSGRRLGKSIKGFGKNVNCVAYRADGKRLATACDDGLIQIWNPAKPNAPLATCRGHEGPVTCVQFSPDGKFLVSSGLDQTIRYWEADTGKSTESNTKLTDAVDWVALDPKGDLVAAASRDGTISVLDLARGRELHRFRGHAGPVLHVAWHPNGKQLASASADGTIRIWDLTTNDLMVPPLRNHAGPVNQLAYSPDGNYLASVSDDKTLWLFSAGSQTPLKVYTEHNAPVRCVGFSSDGTLLASASADGKLILRPFSIKPAARVLSGHTARVEDVAWNSDGTILASSRGVKAGQDDPAAGSEIILWNPATGKPQFTLTGHTQRVYHIAFQPKGSLLASASQDGTVRLWNATNGSETKELSRQRLPYYGLAWSPDGKRLAASCDFEEDGKALTRVTAWDVVSGNQVATFTHPQYWMECLVWSPDGKLLAGGSSESKDVFVWQASSGELLHTFQGHTGAIQGLAFSPNSWLLASASADESVRVWDMKNKNDSRILKGHSGGVRAVTFHPDGKRLATASDDKQAKLWDLGTYQEIFTLSGHTDTVAALVFRPDGNQLATASRDLTVRIWDATPLPQEVAGGKRD